MSISRDVMRWLLAPGRAGCGSVGESSEHEACGEVSGTETGGHDGEDSGWHLAHDDVSASVDSGCEPQDQRGFHGGRCAVAERFCEPEENVGQQQSTDEVGDYVVRRRDRSRFQTLAAKFGFPWLGGEQECASDVNHVDSQASGESSEKRIVVRHGSRSSFDQFIHMWTKLFCRSEAGLSRDG